jgi:hypothetical protein
MLQKQQAAHQRCAVQTIPIHHAVYQAQPSELSADAVHFACRAQAHDTGDRTRDSDFTRQKNKNPTWIIRRQLFSFFTKLMTCGSLRDVYLFCLHNTYELRLALMEHFIFFSSTNMQAEMKLLLKCTGLSYNPSSTKTLIEYITDHFRTASLQNELLDWSLIESKAAHRGTLQSHVQGTAAARLRAAAKLWRHSELCAHKTHARQSTCRRQQLRCKLAAHLHAGHGFTLCPQLEAVQVRVASAGAAQTV